MVQEAGSERTAQEDILRKTNTELTYDPATGNLVTVVETDIVTGKTRTSILTWDVLGNLVSVVQS